MVFVNGSVVVDEVLKAHCCVVDVSVKLVVLCSREVSGGYLV